MIPLLVLLVQLRGAPACPPEGDGVLGEAETILAAEAHVEALQANLNDPEVVADHVRLQAAWQKIQAAQERVTQLYARWEELESRRSRSW